MGDGFVGAASLDQSDTEIVVRHPGGGIFFKRVGVERKHVAIVAGLVEGERSECQNEPDGRDALHAWREAGQAAAAKAKIARLGRY